MPKRRKFLHNPEDLLTEAYSILQSKPTDYEFLYKVELVKNVLQGKYATEIAKHCYLSPRSVQLLVQKADELGFDSLHEKNRSGRPPILTSYQKDEIKCVLDDPNSAYELGYTLWDGLTLANYINSQYDVEVSVRYCQNLFHEFNFTLKVPQVFPNYQSNQEKRENFKQTLTKLMKDPNNIIVSQDEVHFQQGTTVTRMWCPRGFIPVVSSSPSQKSIAYSGFVILGKQNGHLFIDKPDWFTYETTIQSISKFLEKYHFSDAFKVYMILDNAPWHKKAKRLIMDETLKEYKSIRDSITFLDIPPYSPDLNPIEQVWRFTRKSVTHNVYFPKIELLETTLDNFWASFQVANATLSSLCTFNFESTSPKREKYHVGNGVYKKWIDDLHECRALIPLPLPLTF